MRHQQQCHKQQQVVRSSPVHPAYLHSCSRSASSATHSGEHAGNLMHLQAPHWLIQLNIRSCLYMLCICAQIFTTSDFLEVCSISRKKSTIWIERALVELAQACGVAAPCAHMLQQPLVYLQYNSPEC